MSDGKAYQDFLKNKFDIGQLFDKPEPLAGVRILEVCYVVLGPAACDYLGEFGAEVIKFEGQKGDQMRFVTPYAYFWKNMSPGLEIENHNKYWVGMHLGHPQNLGMRRISAGRSVLGFFKNSNSHCRCTELPSQVRSGAMSPPRPLMRWQLKQARSVMSCPALPAGW